MRVEISEMHNSHGPVFTLFFTVERGRDDDDEVLKHLNRLLAHSSKRAVLYTYAPVELSGTEMVLKLTEGFKKLAKIDHQWNLEREDQKFVAVEIEGDEGNYPDGLGPPPHYICAVCGKDTYGVDRDTMEVFDIDSRKIETVSVHNACKTSRLQEIAKSLCQLVHK